MKKNKIIVILGPTASGKSDLGVLLAKKFNGEIISADSRQVYKNLDIGSGKITKKEMRNIPHYLLDEASLKRNFTVAQFKKKAEKIINDILKKGKTPFVVGGTGFYIQAITDNLILPETKINLKLRKDLEKKTLGELVELLRKLDKTRLEQIDQKNSRRLIRAIEIASDLGKVPVLKKGNCDWDILEIGIKEDEIVLKERIARRFKKRLKQGIVKETQKIHQSGVSLKRINEIGLAHKHIVSYLKGLISKEDMVNFSIKEEWRYAKKQKIWFKKDKRILWFGLNEIQKIESAVKEHLER